MCRGARRGCEGCPRAGTDGHEYVRLMGTTPGSEPHATPGPDPRGHHGPAAPARTPQRRSLTGPVVLTVVGAVLLVLALVLAIGTAAVLARAVSSAVVGPDGRPGDSVVAVADAPGSTTVRLEAGETYDVYLVADGAAGDVDLEDDVLLLAPSGEVVAADDDPVVDTRTRVGRWSTESVGAFTAPEDGTYQVAVPPADTSDAWVAIVPARELGPFVSSIAGTVLGILGVVVLAGLGLAALVAGIVWWVLRARSNRRLAGPPPLHPYPGTHPQ